MDYKVGCKFAHIFMRKFLNEYETIIVGSLRRKLPKVKDIDFLIIGDHSKDILNKLNIKDVIIISSGSKSIMLTYKKIRVDLFFTALSNIIPALLHYTGSKTFNIRIRKHAKNMGYKLNQYGLYKNDKKIKLRNEKDIFKILNIEYKNPEDRTH
jgi:DNA polymerase (family X)